MKKKMFYQTCCISSFLLSSILSLIIIYRFSSECKMVFRVQFIISKLPVGRFAFKENPLTLVKNHFFMSNDERYYYGPYNFPQRQGMYGISKLRTITKSQKKVNNCATNEKTDIPSETIKHENN